MDKQLESIKTKLELLRSSDPNYKLFGASTHQYKLNPTISMEVVRQFELTHHIDLPDGYTAFLTKIGNGGAGPYYGLERLEDALFDDLDYKRPGNLLNPAKPFLHTAPWNQTFTPTVEVEKDEEEYERQRMEFEKEYFDRQQMNGVIAICNFGCAVRLNLVVNGQEYGNIWTDDRSSDNGIHPSCELGNKDKISFLDWYEMWLDKSLKERAGKS